MGAILPKPVESTLVERRAAGPFRVGVAEMNGWRSNMEDAHLVHMQPEWGFFGIFDGHGGDKCSAFVAGRLKEELHKRGCPEDDTALKQLVLGVDKAFLDTQQASGSTGAMCVIHGPGRGRGRCRVRVANCGDSRVLLGRRDGTIVDGGGTDQGLTTDHKPSNPSERQRIYRCGGHVEEAAGGVPRVNGELAVSRGFGDADFKKTGGPGPEDRPVTANPELGHFECDSADFLLLVCDGVSEGDFSNAQVVKLVADMLRKKEDPGAAAEAVCKKAIEANSKDNISCMVVLLSGAGQQEEQMEFNPGPLTAPEDKAFMTAYEAMAKRAGLTLAQAAELRYERLQQLLASGGGAQAEGLKSELTVFGSPAGAKGSDERKMWFLNWVQKLPEKQKSDKDGDGGGLDPDRMLMRMLMARLGGQEMLAGLLGGDGNGQGAAGRGSGRRVRAPDVALLKRAVDDHPALEWDSRMASIAGVDGIVKTDDPSDGTSNVLFPPPIDLCAWLPTGALISLDGDGTGRVVSPGGRRQGVTPPTSLTAGASAMFRSTPPMASGQLSGLRGPGATEPRRPSAGAAGAASLGATTPAGRGAAAARSLQGIAPRGPPAGRASALQRSHLGAR